MQQKNKTFANYFWVCFFFVAQALKQFKSVKLKQKHEFEFWVELGNNFWDYNGFLREFFFKNKVFVIFLEKLNKNWNCDIGNDKYLTKNENSHFLIQMTNTVSIFNLQFLFEGANVGAQ